MGLSNKQKAVIHIAKLQLGLTEDEYRDALQTHGGASSSKDLTKAGFFNVMKHFEKSGFKSKSGPSTGSRRPHTERAPGMATTKQIKKIYALWWTLEGIYYHKGANFKALREFLGKRFGVDHENFLTFGTAYEVIEAVKKIGTRQGAPIWN